MFLRRSVGLGQFARTASMGYMVPIALI
jgi:hypothetical protein